MRAEVGVIVVHGIGEQGRFEHLDSQVRGLVNALRRRPGAAVTVEINGSDSAAFHATQAAWKTGPGGAIRIVVRDGAAVTHIHVHEVWWADVNESYSVWKQVRFWAWGLSVWNYPAHAQADLPTGGSVFPPRPGRGGDKRPRTRAELFLVSCFFMLISLTLGLLTVLTKRLLNWDPPSLVRVFVNYLSSIKLYAQRRRGGGELLDNIGNPPRTSVRRRMIRTLAEVAGCGYDRWYILAHSQGAVVAFNGLMEPAAGWPGYLDEAGWNALVCKGLAGPAEPGFPMPGKEGMTPAWPAWAPPGSVAYRRQVFRNFKGLLTYGAPIEKFAAIWPARVPVCREPAFKPGTVWLNVFDPLDPVSGVMRSWPTKAPANLPDARNVGYASHWLLLLGHIKYLGCPSTKDAATPQTVTLADGVADWLLRDDDAGIGEGRRYFLPGNGRARRRGAATVAWCALAFALAAVLAGSAISFALLLVHKELGFHEAFGFSALLRHSFEGLAGAVAVTLVAGLVSRFGTDRKLTSSRPADVPFTPIPPPYPDPFPLPEAKNPPARPDAAGRRRNLCGDYQQ